MTQTGVTLDIPPLTAPVATTSAASNITADGATLNGTVNPNGSTTGYYFEWGTDTTYGNTTALTEIASGVTNVSVTATLTGLTTGTTYYFRLVAYNAGGLTLGQMRVSRQGQEGRHRVRCGHGEQMTVVSLGMEQRYREPLLFR